MMPSPAPATAPLPLAVKVAPFLPDAERGALLCACRGTRRDCGAAGERDASLLDLGLGAGVGRARVLLLGDGDLSYAVALASCDDCCESRVELTATTFEPDEQLFARYARARENARLLARRGARVMHGVDATERDTWRDGEWDRIVWNFPHHPDRRKVQKHRQLLRSFFAAAAPVVGHADGEVWVTLMAGQGGTASERPGTARRWEDSWQIVAQAAAADLVLVRVRAVGEGELASLRGLGYGAVGFRSQDRAFRTAGALTHVFARARSGREAIHSVPWPCDLAFWTDGRGDAPPSPGEVHETASEFDEGAWIARVKDALAAAGASAEFSLLDEYTDAREASPHRGRRARTYRITLTAVGDHALSRERAIRLVEEDARRVPVV